MNTTKPGSAEIVVIVVLMKLSLRSPTKIWSFLTDPSFSAPSSACRRSGVSFLALKVVGIVRSSKSDSDAPSINRDRRSWLHAGQGVEQDGVELAALLGLDVSLRA